MFNKIAIIPEEDFNELKSKLDLILEKLKANSGNTRQSQIGDWITEREAQELLERSTGTLWKLRTDGKVTSSKINGKTYYSVKSIYKLLDKNKKVAYK